MKPIDEILNENKGEKSRIKFFRTTEEAPAKWYFTAYGGLGTVIFQEVEQEAASRLEKALEDNELHCITEFYAYEIQKTGKYFYNK